MLPKPMYMPAPMSMPMPVPMQMQMQTPGMYSAYQPNLQELVVHHIQYVSTFKNMFSFANSMD